MEIIFLTELDVTALSDGENWILNSDLVYSEDGVEKTILKGTITDFASIPSFSRVGGVIIILGLIANGLGHGHFGLCLSAFGLMLVFLADAFNRDTQLDKPATAHDVDYNQIHRTGIYWVTDKLVADYKLFAAMKATKRSLVKRLVVYLGVTIGGWLAWYQDGKKALAASKPPVV
jgi:hypothetical protein